MNVLNEALELLGLAGGSGERPERHELGMTRTRNEQRELAERMRRLPGRFADRLPDRTTKQVTDAAAAGRWEQAVDELITALHVHAGRVTDRERAELHAVLEALSMPADRADALLTN